MKINSLFLAITIYSLISCSNDDDQLKETILIPDAEFEQILVEQHIDSDNTINGEILKSDAEQIHILDLNKDHSFGDIQDLTGIEGFTNLTFLSAANQKITEVDLSANTKLDTLYMHGNLLKEISFVRNPNLILIDIQSNELESIKGLFYVTSLKQLNASFNNLKFLNVANGSIEVLYVSHNLLKGLFVTSATNLKNIFAISNQITPYLNTTNNTKLETLVISDNLISEINLEHNPNLTHLYGSSNQFNSLDVSYNHNLIDLRIDRNPNLTCIQKGSDQNIDHVSLSTYQSINQDCD